ncbi:hypothetical protein EDC55_12330 [Allofrancisella inopinata]|uniref:hypothetical protein n=1 Tax=Allofrancisella inopinata TaxID=1085647 RepID=UPI001062F7FB|nr:hypothetical protein [Allofrancisella inopinata]TDT67480.1 hypothetical protein EDC55_12330 [Allofrancisella inopinata]
MGGIADVDDFDIFENPKVDSMQHNSYSILKLPKANIILDRNTWKLTDIHRSHKSTSFSWTISNIEEGKIKVIVYKSNTAGYEYNIYFHNGKNKAINTITKIKCLKILSHHYGCGVAVAYK